MILYKFFMLLTLEGNYEFFYLKICIGNRSFDIDQLSGQNGKEFLNKSKSISIL